MTAQRHFVRQVPQVLSTAHVKYQPKYFNRLNTGRKFVQKTVRTVAKPGRVIGKYAGKVIRHAAHNLVKTTKGVAQELTKPQNMIQAGALALKFM